MDKDLGRIMKRVEEGTHLLSAKEKKANLLSTFKSWNCIFIKNSQKLAYVLKAIWKQLNKFPQSQRRKVLFYYNTQEIDTRPKNCQFQESNKYKAR